MLYGDGSRGPYCIGSSFADTATLTIKFSDSAAIPPWTIISDRNAIFFSQPIDSGVPIHITFHTIFYGVPKIFSLYTKTYLDRFDTTQRQDTFIAHAGVPQREEKLNVSGYKSVGVSVGSFGQVNLEQGLDVQIGGEIRPQTTVKAHLSDQGSSLDGQTREISDFDMIYITLDDPSFHAVAGDQYVGWPFKGLLSGQKKIKGLSANYSPMKTPFSLGAFGALAGGQVAIETKQGRTGVQGPYYLSGNGEQDFIQPVTGTVKVRLNGRELEEGTDKDFIVDYQLGTISFTPKNLIKDEDLIRIEYEYKLFNYQRVLFGTTAAFAPADSSFSVQGVFWSESDNKNNPIDLTLTNPEIAALQSAGDHPPYASTAKPVHPNDVASESQFYPLYRKSVAGTDTFFVYTPFNLDHPDSVLGFYYVWFRQIKAGEKGSYRILSTDLRGPIYTFAGKDSGTYTDLSPLPSPEARRSGEIKAEVKLKNLSATLDIAGQDIDHNLFSSLDDKDNLASATSFTFLAGTKDRDRRSVWLSGSHRFVSRRFDAEVLSAYDRKEQWDDTSLSQNDAGHQQWDATGGATPLRGLQTSLSYGQDRTDSLLVTDRLSPSLQYAWNNRFLLDYGGSFFRHLDPGEKGTGRREHGSVQLTFPRQTYGLFYRDEWRSDSRARGSGLYEGGVSYAFSPLSLKEQLSYMSRRKIRSGESWSADTGYSVRWEQSFDHSLLPSWHVTGSSSFDRTENYGASRTATMLLDLVSDVTPKNYGFSSRQHFRTNTEMTSSFIQIPVFAGKGMGTYVYDSVRNEYVPHVPGDYFMQQQEVYDQSQGGINGLRVRKTSTDITWAYEPKRHYNGILNDLSWQGALFCEEHVDAGQNSLQTWIPGYSSIASYFGNTSAGEPIRYADLSYRQDIDWKPRHDSAATAKGRLSITPAYRKIRGYIEGSVETRLESFRTVHLWTFGGALNLLSLNHNDTTGIDNYSVYDRRLELSQKYRLFNGANLSLQEVTGLAHKTTGPPSSQTVPFDSTFYYQIVPSFTWQPSQKATLTAMYTYSVVPLQGEMDYRMARGFLGGISHQIGINADIKMGERLLIVGTYRGDVRKPINAVSFNPANHVFSLEVRVFM
jgi:hypothetical protein